MTVIFRCHFGQIWVLKVGAHFRLIYSAHQKVLRFILTGPPTKIHHAYLASWLWHWRKYIILISHPDSATDENTSCLYISHQDWATDENTSCLSRILTGKLTKIHHAYLSSKLGHWRKYIMLISHPDWATDKNISCLSRILTGPLTKIHHAYLASWPATDENTSCLSHILTGSLTKIHHAYISRIKTGPLTNIHHAYLASWLGHWRKYIMLIYLASLQ